MTKKITALLLTFMIFFAAVTPVFADDAYSFDITTDKASYTVGRAVVIDASVKVNGTLKAGYDVLLKITNPKNSPVFVKQGSTDEYGKLSAQFIIQSDAEIGSYKITAKAVGIEKTVTFTVAKPSDNDDDSGSGGGGSGGSGSKPSVPAEPKKNADGTVSIPKQTPTLDGKTGEARLSLSQSTLDSAFKLAVPDAKGIRRVIVEAVPVKGARSYAAALPAKALATSSSAALIEIRTEFGTILAPSNMLTPAEIAGAKTVELIIGKANTDSLSPELKAKLDGKPLIELGLELDGVKKAYNNANAPVTISVDYVPTAEELKNPDNIVVWYIDGEGNIVEVPNGKYDPATGKVTFTVTHFSMYAVAYVKKSFSDISKYTWAEKEINSMTARGIINELPDNTFDPSANITRGDFIYGLVRAVGLTAKVEVNFTDVDKSDYYWNEIAVAKKLGIAQGGGSNSFNPKAYITREDMAALIDRALTVSQKSDNTADGDLTIFADYSSISDYAIDSLKSIVAQGILKGDGKNINPRSNCTRAESAVILYRIYNK